MVEVSIYKTVDIMKLEKLSESELVLYEEIYTLYFHAVYKHILRKVINEDRADDYTSDTFLRVAGHIKEFEKADRENRLRLLYAYANSVIVENMRKEAGRKTVNFTDMDYENEDGETVSFEENINAAIDIQNVIADKAFIEAIKSEIQSLSPKRKKVFLMRYVECMKTEEIAKKLGMNPSTLRTLLQKTLIELRKKLEDYRK